ncbi:hypothetical protein B0919_18335 [Hymenobacter sp. CRA2]|nr:hypothetical protein B0919_18335 [Hymenobacter sp. CRA2]
MVQTFMGSTVVLTNGDTLHGPLALRQDMDLLLITMPDRTVRTVPALAVRTFAVRGELIRHEGLLATTRDPLGPGISPVQVRRRWHDVQRARPFLVYPWDHDRDNSAMTTPAFFERLNGGPFVLLRRQQLVQRSTAASDPYLPSALGNLPYRRSSARYYYTDVRESFYLGTPQGTVVALRRPKRDLLAYFPAEADAIEQYARDNGLSFTDSFHLARLVDYANSLRTLAVQ